MMIVVIQIIVGNNSDHDNDNRNYSDIYHREREWCSAGEWKESWLLGLWHLEESGRALFSVPARLSFYIQRLPSRPGARFRPLECHIHPAVAQSEGGCEFAGLAEGGEVGRAEGTFVRRRARITGGRSGRVRRCFVAPEQGRRRSATFDRTGRDVRSGIGRSCRI